jgi:DNA polymerase III delta subunit
MDNKAELVIQALQERIGQLVSMYETNMAILRAEITQLTDQIKESENNSTQE